MQCLGLVGRFSILLQGNWYISWREGNYRTCTSDQTQEESIDPMTQPSVFYDFLNRLYFIDLNYDDEVHLLK